MSLDIDITDLKSREIIKILDLYSYGRLEIKFDRIFWCSDYAEPQEREPRRPLEPLKPGQRPRNALEESSQRFKRASDVLGSMIGP